MLNVIMSIECDDSMTLCLHDIVDNVITSLWVFKELWTATGWHALAGAYERRSREEACNPVPSKS